LVYNCYLHFRFLQWDALGDLFEKSDDSMVIAKMDATLNEIDVEGVVIKGFPTIYLFPNGGKPIP